MQIFVKIEIHNQTSRPTIRLAMHDLRTRVGLDCQKRSRSGLCSKPTEGGRQGGGRGEGGEGDGGTQVGRDGGREGRREEGGGRREGGWERAISWYW